MPERNRDGSKCQTGKRNREFALQLNRFAERRDARAALCRDGAPQLRQRHLVRISLAHAQVGQRRVEVEGDVVGGEIGAMIALIL